MSSLDQIEAGLEHVINHLDAFSGTELSNDDRGRLAGIAGLATLVAQQVDHLAHSSMAGPHGFVPKPSYEKCSTCDHWRLRKK